MKMFMIIECYNILEKICNTPMAFKNAYGIKMLMNNLSPHRTIAMEAEHAVVDKYNACINEDGTITTEDGSLESASNFANDMNDIFDTDVEWNYGKIQIGVDAFCNIELSVKEVERLSNFIDFI